MKIKGIKCRLCKPEKQIAFYENDRLYCKDCGEPLRTDSEYKQFLEKETKRKKLRLEQLRNEQEKLEKGILTI